MPNSEIEYLRYYLWKDFDTEEKRGVNKYFSREGNSKDVDFIVFFKTEGDQIAFDNCDNIPPLNYQDVIDRGRNLKRKIEQINVRN